MSTLVIVLAAALAADADLAITSRSIVRQTNQFRKQHDLQPVRTNDRLKRAAQYFADYLARHEQLDHEADGSTPAERAEKYGYEYCMVLENIADEFKSEGFETDQLAQSLVRGWQGSQHHRENMLDADVTETGVAVAQSEKSGRY